MAIQQGCNETKVACALTCRDIGTNGIVAGLMDHPLFRGQRFFSQLLWRAAVDRTRDNVPATVAVGKKAAEDRRASWMFIIFMYEAPCERYGCRCQGVPG